MVTLYIKMLYRVTIHVVPNPYRYVQIQKNTFMKDIPTLLSQCFGDIAYPGSYLRSNRFW